MPALPFWRLSSLSGRKALQLRHAKAAVGSPVGENRPAPKRELMARPHRLRALATAAMSWLGDRRREVS